MTTWQECPEEPWDMEKRKESALDLVELLNVEECATMEDDENWLYTLPWKQAFVEKGSKSKWCGKVLDNPSPDAEMACQTPTHILHQSLRQDYAFIPGTESPKNPHSSSSPLSNHRRYGLEFDKYRLEDLIGYPRPSCQLPCSPPSPLSSSICQSPTSTIRPTHNNTPLPRASHQLAHSKPLELTRNRVPLRSSSMPDLNPPPRTSLCSFQAVQNGRNTEDNVSPPLHTTHQSYPINLSTSGAASARFGNTGQRSASSTAKSTSSSCAVLDAGARQFLRESVQAASSRGLQRAQSLSPFKILRPGKRVSVGGYLSCHGRVYASPERSTALAWVRIEQPDRR